MPLTPIPLASQSYTLDSTPASVGRLLNLYAEKQPDGARAPFILKPAPGLVEWVTVGTGPITAMAATPTFLYVASGPRFYRFTAGVTAPVDLGPIPESFATTIALSADEAVICTVPECFVVSHGGSALNPITRGSGNFPDDGASSVANIDGYFVFTTEGGRQFIVSSALSGATFDGLDFAASSRQRDYVFRAVNFNNELWLFGLDGSTVWYNAGATDFPFRERGGSHMDKGLGAASSLVPLDNSLFWVGSDRVVYRSQGYQPRRVSSHAVEEMLIASGDLSTLLATSYVFDGHSFYALTISELNRTVVYDVATDQWHERSSAVDGAGKWRGRGAVHFDRKLLIGDLGVGKLYQLDATAGDAGTPLAREAALPPIVSHGPRDFMGRLEVEMEVGTAGAPGTVQLDWSDDGGSAWSAGRALSTGAMGATRTRVAATRLGSFRQRVLRLRATGAMTVYGVDADVVQGNI